MPECGEIRRPKSWEACTRRYVTVQTLRITKHQPPRRKPTRSMKAYTTVPTKYLARSQMAAGGGRRHGSNLNILLATFQEAIELNLFGPLANYHHRNQRLPLPSEPETESSISLSICRGQKISLSRSAIHCTEQSHCRGGTQVERFGRCWRFLELAEAPALVHQKTNAIKHRRSSSSRPGQLSIGKTPWHAASTERDNHHRRLRLPHLYHSLTASISICRALVPDPCASMDPAQ
jgi:hypothetical protein